MGRALVCFGARLCRTNPLFYLVFGSDSDCMRSVGSLNVVTDPAAALRHADREIINMCQSLKKQSVPKERDGRQSECITHCLIQNCRHTGKKRKKKNRTKEQDYSMNE